MSNVSVDNGCSCLCKTDFEVAPKKPTTYLMSLSEHQKHDPVLGYLLSVFRTGSALATAFWRDLQDRYPGMRRSCVGALVSSNIIGFSESPYPEKGDTLGGLASRSPRSYCSTFLTVLFFVRGCLSDY